MTGEGAIPPQERYRLDPRHVGRGGFAEVFKATRRDDGEVVALKRARRVPQAEARLKREIEVQRSLPHPNIMPIYDADPGFSWFTMPLAVGNLQKLRDELDEEDLASILLHVADALEVAHAQGYIHRDISPGNILAFPSSGSKYRWVVADWGLVHRPPRGSSAPLTKVGEAMGTEGFAAPEVWRDGTAVTEAADVYSLGRVAAWFLTGERPSPGEMLLPEGQYQHWRGFIRACTETNLSERLSTMRQLRARFQGVFALKDEPPVKRARRLIEELLLGDKAQLGALVSLAEDHEDDAAVYIDHLARVPTADIRAWAASASDQAARLAVHMARHLRGSPWEDRDAQYVGTPLAFVHTVIQTLLEAGQSALAEDVAEDFFKAETYWRYEPQRLRTVEWLADLDEADGTALARAFAGREDVLDYYRQPSTWTCRCKTLSRLLRR